MCDYSCVWPVWGEGSGIHDGDEELPISEDLRQDLLDWQEFFEQHLHHERGWDTEAAGDEWLARGWDLQRRMQTELNEPVQFRP
jgi:hypothetical protein